MYEDLIGKKLSTVQSELRRRYPDKNQICYLSGKPHSGLAIRNSIYIYHTRWTKKVTFIYDT